MNARIRTPDLKTLREDSILRGRQFTLTEESNLGELFDRNQNRQLDDAMYAAEQQWSKYGYFKSPAVDYVAVVDATAQPDCLEGYDSSVIAGELDRGNGFKTTVRMRLDSTEFVRDRVIMTFVAEAIS